MSQKTKTILVVGSLNMDLVVSVTALPQKGETIFGNTFATFPGGKGANQAVAAGKLGAKVAMVGVVGQDAFADILLESLGINGVETTFIRHENISTGTALITVDRGGSNTIVVVAGANGLCHGEDVEKAFNIADEPGILLIQHEIPMETVEYAIKQGKEKGWTVILNPAPARPVPTEILASVDIIIPNETEAAVITGRAVKSPEDAAVAAQTLLERGAGAVIITLGEKGALCCSGGEVRHILPYKVKAVDTTAAGDAYAGALATALAEGKELFASAKFASAVAALSVTRAGAQPALPLRREVDEFIAREK